MILKKIAEEKATVSPPLHETNREQSYALMHDVVQFQATILETLGTLVEADTPFVGSHPNIEQLGKCRRSQLDHIRKQALMILHIVTHNLMMSQNIEAWLEKQPVTTFAGDYDLAMINTDFTLAYDILYRTENNLNHNYLSTFTGWGQKNTTLEDQDQTSM